MSRIGRKPVVIPAGVEVTLDGNTVTVKGPKGTLTRTFHNRMNIAVENNEIVVTRPSDDKEDRSLHGLTRTSSAVLTNRSLDSLQLKFVKNANQSHIRAKVLSTLTKLSSARKVKLVKVNN